MRKTRWGIEQGHIAFLFPGVAVVVWRFTRQREGRATGAAISMNMPED